MPFLRLVLLLLQQRRLEMRTGYGLCKQLPATKLQQIQRRTAHQSSTGRMKLGEQLGILSNSTSTYSNILELCMDCIFLYIVDRFLMLCRKSHGFESESDVSLIPCQACPTDTQNIESCEYMRVLLQIHCFLTVNLFAVHLGLTILGGSTRIGRS